jgi:hypothetical protein
MKRHHVLAIALLASTAVVYGCTSILGLGDYKIGKEDAAAGDASPDVLAGESGCEQTENVLNACTDSTCVPYDDKQRIKHPDFTSETKLPPVPDLPVDSGSGG